MKKLMFVILCIGFLYPVNAQNQEITDYISKIELKLSKDKNYLNLNYINFQPNKNTDPELQVIPRAENRKALNLQYSENIYYRLIFLKEGFKIDSTLLLYMEEIKLNNDNSNKLFGAVNQDGNDTTKVLDFKDIYYLKNYHRNHYNKLFKLVENYLEQNDEVPPPSLLAINPDKALKTDYGISSRDNTDFLNYEYVNGKHWYPVQQENNKSIRRRKKIENEKPKIRLDVSFSGISFSHEAINPKGTTSLEVTTSEELLNLLPWQSSTISAGLRTLLNFSDKDESINTADLIDIKLLARIKMNSAKLFVNQPFTSAEAPKLNFTNGIIGDINLTRPFSLPFTNLYFSVGKRSFDDPAMVLKENGINTAYFSFSQFSAAMSFYWNSSEKLTNRFRIDLGAGFYDIWKAQYDQNMTLINGEQVQHKFFPVVSLYYNFVPDNNPLFGGKLKFFDSQVNLSGWMKIVEFSKTSSLRLEGQYIFSPFARILRPWETEKEYMFQLRYRYGL